MITHTSAAEQTDTPNGGVVKVAIDLMIDWQGGAIDLGSFNTQSNRLVALTGTKFETLQCGKMSYSLLRPHVPRSAHFSLVVYYHTRLNTLIGSSSLGCPGGISVIVYRDWCSSKVPLVVLGSRCC